MHGRSITGKLCFILLIAASFVQADVTIPKVLGDNMVLQRDRPVPIWGQAAANEQVTVRFNGQTKASTADETGNWRIMLDALPVSATPMDMSITGRNAIQLKNILVGEVWLCSGQSNMEFPMQPVGNFSSTVSVLPKLKESLATAENPHIRLFKVEKNLETFTTKGWRACKPDTVDTFSAIGYFYGKELQEELKVPIGLIQVAWGGTRIEPWIAPEAYEVPPTTNTHAAPESATVDRARIGTHFNVMVRPLIPYAIRGVIWYQGESNIIANNDRERYFGKFKRLVGSWRSLWDEGDFSFNFCQLAPYRYSLRQDPLHHSDEELPLVWEAQLNCLAIPNVAMAATIDLVDDLEDIHPANKWDVAHRLALIALAKDYGRKDLVYAGPTFKAVEFRDGKARITFDNTGSGLASRDNQPLTGFSVVGSDGTYQPATATIDGQTVVVESPAVKDPKTVHFGWSESAQPNLINNEGLPAISFRNDYSVNN